MKVLKALLGLVLIGVVAGFVLSMISPQLNEGLNFESDDPDDDLF
jgi:hypothetical protein